jgi:uncharacterized lipoprotein YmbA
VAGSAARPAGDATVIGIAPPMLPRYLEDDAIAVRRSATQIEYLEFHHWAEPLPEGVARTLLLALRNLLPEAHVLRAPWPPRTTPDTTVRIHVERFEPVGGREVVLKGSYAVGQGRSAPTLHPFHVTVPAADAPRKMVEAMGKALDELARSIAATVDRN